MNRTAFVWICVCLFGLTVIFTVTGEKASAEKSTPGRHEPLGCYLGGKVFEEFFPTAVELRETAFLTPFGTLNTNIVLGNSITGKAASGVLELSERIGEFLFSVNTSAMAEHIALLDQDVPEKYLQEKTMILVGGPRENTLVRRLVDAGTSNVD